MMKNNQIYMELNFVIDVYEKENKIHILMKNSKKNWLKFNLRKQQQQTD